MNRKIGFSLISKRSGESLAPLIVPLFPSYLTSNDLFYSTFELCYQVLLCANIRTRFRVRDWVIVRVRVRRELLRVRVALKLG